MREINRFATGHYRTKDQAPTERNATVKRVGVAAGMAEGVSFFERMSQHDKYHSMQGHGFAAEDANALNDMFQGKKVDKVGTSNALNGADRIVDGVQIQVKYCQNAEATVNSLFDEAGKFRYDGMTIEVPKEQAQSVRELLKEKAKNGKLTGPNGRPLSGKQIDAMIQEGSVTYKQAKYIARAGNLDSIWFDVKNSAVTFGCSLGISFAVGMAQAMWSGKDLKAATTFALKQSLAAGLGTLVISVASQQLMRTSVSTMGKFASHYAVHGLYQTSLGKTAIEKLASYSLQRGVYGAAAVNHVSKLLRSNVITSVVTTAVLTAPDFYRAAISGTASWKQLGKNLAVNAASVAGGTGGWMAGAAAGAVIGSAIPVVGTAAGGIIGGIAGALGGGMFAGKAAKAVADQITPDDSQEMLALCQDAAAQLASDYLLTEQEMEIFVQKLHDLINLDFLRDMYGSGASDKQRCKWARQQFKPLVTSIVAARRSIALPSAEELAALTALSLAEIENELSPAAQAS